MHAQICTRKAPHVCTVNGPCNGFPKDGAELAADVDAGAAALDNHQRWCRENIHVYEVSEDIWIAAEGPDAAVLYYVNNGFGDDEVLDEFGAPVELTSEIMAGKKFYDEARPEIDTFQKAFDDLLYHGQDFPMLFASVN